MRWSNIKIRKGVKIGVFSLVLFLAIGFVEKRHQDKVCTSIDIQIDNHFDNYFIDQNDMMHLITENGGVNITGVTFNDLQLKEIELRVKEHRFVRDAEVYKDLQGNLVVKVHQNIPMARLVQTDGPDAYISTDGRVLPVSEKFTARVMVIGGDYTRKLVKQDLTTDSASTKIFDMLQYIENDKFLKAQIAHIDINSKGEISFFPQIGKQVIEFGKAENIDQKFNKLKLFYKVILPQKGWNTYERVNLNFRSQIICE